MLVVTSQGHIQGVAVNFCSRNIY